MKYVVVDLETTGQAPELNEIIEIGAVVVEKKRDTLKVTKKFETLIKPYSEIPPIITNITGIDDTMVDKAPRFQDVAEKFINFIGDAVFVAHNAIFDLRMLNIALKRYGFVEIENPMIDTQDLIAIAYPTMPSHRLADVIDALKIKVKDRHRALADAEATATVLIDTLAKIKKLPIEIIYQFNKLMANIDDPLKDILSDLQKKVLAKATPEELSGLNNWKKYILVKAKFKKSKYERTDEIKPLKTEALKSYFSAEGRLKEAFKTYEFREQQLVLAENIINCFNYQEHALIEAGTGTGKTIAYLMPVLLWIIQNGGPVVISTRTKNLQDQLVDKDIPAIQQLFPKTKFQIAILKGRQNYVCLRRLELLLHQYLKSQNKGVIPVLALLSWAIETQDGDLSELHSSLEKRFGPKIYSDYYSCDGEKCGNFRTCFVQHVRRQARYADLIIGNHSLVLTDLAGGAGLLPDYRELICDEAHTLEDAVTEAFSASLHLANFLDELKALDSLCGKRELLKISDSLKIHLRDLYGTLALLNPRGPEDSKLGMAKAQEAENWPEISLIVNSIQKNIKKYLKLIEENSTEQEEDARQIEIKAARKKLEERWNSLEKIFAGMPNFTSWLRFSRAKEPFNVFAEMAPIDIGEIMQKNIFSQKDSVILTSATLTINKNFNYFKQRFGITPEIEENFKFIELGSPFNYQQKMLLALPDDLPAISQENAPVVAVAEYLLEIFKIFGGRTLVLFTSYRLMERVYSVVRSLANELGFNVLCQGTHGSRSSLLSRFRNTNKTALLGTSSFWEGVDVAGDMLSCVVIVKLPFAVPTEPVYAERAQVLEKQGINSFFNYSVPQAVIKFKQGIGRLIRTANDRGVVVVLDERIFSKNYGKYFLDSLPPCGIIKGTRKKVLEKITSWFCSELTT